MAFINKDIEGLLNFRIAQEEYSSRLYLAMSKWLIFNGYKGAGKLWKKYADEEMTHAGWAYTYLEDLDLLPTVPELAAPPVDFTSLPEICTRSYKHELVVTQQCNELAKKALDVNDFMTLELAQKYLKEQAEEIGRQSYWLDRLTSFGDSKEALFLLDNEMGE
jgi:ferritin